MSKRDYYKVLGIERNATETEIKKAYRKIAKENHPDVKPNDSAAESLFKEAAEAYETLSDSNKKAQYDRFGHQKQSGYQRHASDVDEILRNFANRNRPVRRGQDLRLNIKLDLEEIFSGEHKKIKYKKMTLCSPCNGKGGHDISRCSTCNGSGMIFRTRQFGNHVLQEQAMCNICQGAGETVTNTCNSCNGQGLVPEDKFLDVEIPAGISDGTQMVQEGGGHAIKNGVDGNIIIRLTQKPHEIFTRNGNDLKYNLKLTYTQLVLGDKVEIPTIEGGRIRLTIPPYSDVGNILRVTNKGMSITNTNNRGDMMVVLGIIIPSEVSDEETKLLKKLEEFNNNVT